MTQHRTTVGDDVEVKLFRIGRRRSRNRVATFGRQPIAHVEAAENNRQRATRMIEHDTQRGMTLEQVQAAAPAKGYEPPYGATTGPWTTRDFVAAVYGSLAGK